MYWRLTCDCRLRRDYVRDFHRRVNDHGLKSEFNYKIHERIVVDRKEGREEKEKDKTSEENGKQT